MLKPIPQKAFILSPEQSFEVHKLKTYINQLDRASLEEMLLSSIEQNMFMKNVVREIARGEVSV